jgi:MFS family permease
MTSTTSRQPVDGTASARRAVFLAWLFAFLLSYFFRSANAVIAGDLRLEFDLDAERLGLMTSAFFGALALAQLPLGVALDRWGSRRVVPAMMLAGAAGALVFASATSFATLTLGRALLGLGFAGVLVGSLQAFGAWFPERRFATVSGLLVGLGTGGALVAGTPLAYLATTVGWRAVFAGGSLLIVAAAATIVLGTREAPRPVGAPPAGPAATGSRANVFRHVDFWRIAVLNLFAVGTLLAVQGLWAGPYLADVHGLPPVAVGNLILAMALGIMIGNFGNGALADRFGHARVAMAAGIGFVACHALLALAGPGVPMLALGALYLAFGSMGAFGVVLFAHVRAIFPRYLGGRAITGINLVGIAGAMGVQWLMGAIIEGGRGASGAYDVLAYRPAFAVTAAIGLLALWVYAPLLRRRGAPAAPSTSRSTEATDPAASWSRSRWRTRWPRPTR